MEQRLSIITIGVNNLPVMKQFYTEKFGWKIEAQANDIVFFKLSGLLLGLYGRKDLANFTGKPPVESGLSPYIMAYMVNSKEEVENLYRQFKLSGIDIIKEPQTPSLVKDTFLLCIVFCCAIFHPLEMTGPHASK